MQLNDFSDVVIGIIGIWVIGIFVLGVCNLLHAMQVKRKAHILISAALLCVMYVILQVIGDILYRHQNLENVEISYRLGQINVIWWIIFIGLITAISITLATFFKHWKETHITPMSVKDSIDMLHAGLCYWEDGGKIILSNKKMEELCVVITGETLLNGEDFFAAIDSECVILPDGSIKYFFHNLVDFNDKKIHELVAADVTELYKKNELLEQETKVLEKMNESLRRYNQDIDETVKKQEILDTKMYIHDEMNRLMLVTSAATEADITDEEFLSILTMWRNNAILLGNESDKNSVNTDISEINSLADLLGIRLNWRGEKPWNLPDAIRELFIMVIREAIANGVKHAAAENVIIDIEKSDGNLIIKISNDGKLPAGNISFGGGLSNIKRMVEEKKGQFKIEINDYFNMILEFKPAN